MRKFGRVLDTTASTFERGAMLSLDGDVERLETSPSISDANLVGAHEMFMQSRGELEWSPEGSIYTRNATGGCIPICAAEITPGGEVKWIYLVHTHGGNDPMNLSASADEPENVYVCIMVSTEDGSSLWGAKNSSERLFKVLDPRDVIPDENALLIYGAHKDLLISKEAKIAVDILY
jgi:hypothetical protein